VRRLLALKIFFSRVGCGPLGFRTILGPLSVGAFFLLDKHKNRPSLSVLNGFYLDCGVMNNDCSLLHL
jgi:hypothetical protein